MCSKHVPTLAYQQFAASLEQRIAHARQLVRLPCGLHAVDVVHVQQQAHAVLDHDAGSEEGLLLQGLGGGGLAPGLGILPHDLCTCAVQTSHTTHRVATMFV